MHLALVELEVVGHLPRQVLDLGGQVDVAGDGPESA